MPKAGTYGPRIPAPDYDKIGKDAEQQVLKDLGLERPESIVSARPDELVVRAARILEQADAELALHLDERDAALAHLWFYEHRIGLAVTAGLATMTYRQQLAKMMFGDKTHPLPNLPNEELAQAAENAGIPRIDDAETTLLKAAPIVHAARIRRETAVRYMQEAVLALSQPPYGWKPERIAAHAGVHRDLIYKQRRAARKRHGLL